MNETVTYVGARYVPAWYNGNETSTWKSATAYQALTIVRYENDIYISKIPVTATVGNPSENASYWAYVMTDPAGDISEINSDIGEINKEITDIISRMITNVSMTNENGIYTFKQTINGVDSEIGSVEVPQNNPIVETKDTVVENNTAGYDFHTLTETTSEGTEQEIGKLYLAQKQVTGITQSGTQLNVATVDQSGNESSTALELSDSDKMDKVNPTGTGSFSLNRKKGTTVGDYSFTEGTVNIASGSSSHAEGSNTTASGSDSHAEGWVNVASGSSSHAEGSGNTASGNESHAEGWANVASGSGSHVEGYYNKLPGSGLYHVGIHVGGGYSKLNGFKDVSKILRVIGNGTGNNALSNACVLDDEGNLFITGKLYQNSDTAVADYTDIPASFTGAGDETAGSVGMVPAPKEGNTNTYLRSNGSWDRPIRLSNTITYTGSLTADHAENTFANIASLTTTMDGSLMADSYFPVEFNTTANTSANIHVISIGGASVNANDVTLTNVNLAFTGAVSAGDTLEFTVKIAGVK